MILRLCDRFHIDPDRAYRLDSGAIGLLNMKGGRRG